MNRWQPRLIVTDLDGTLLSSRSRLSLSTRWAIRRAREAGIRVVPCSGRYFPGTRAIAWRAGMGDLLIVGNGAQVRTFAGEILFQRLLEPTDCVNVLNIARKWSLACNLYAGDTIYAQAPNRVLDYYRKLNRTLPTDYYCPCVIVDDLSRIIEKQADALLKMELLPVSEGAADELRALGGRSPQLAFEGNWRTSLEAHAAGVDKGTGLKFAAAYYGLSPAETLAFGDGENDVPLLQAAFAGAAMGNAVEQARVAADFVVPDNDHHGVARTIRKYI